MNGMKPTIFGMLLVLAGLGTAALAAEDPPKQRLDQTFVAGKFRIFYCLEGPSAVPADDADQSGVPDRVEDVARQLNVAYRLFCEVLKFPDPLASERYPGVTCIQVSLRQSKSNGTAFDESGRARAIPEGQPGERALSIAISNRVDPQKNVTPAHEFFHLIQYGATYFKNRWYLEGMTRWAEHAVSSGGLGDVRYPAEGPWPQSESHQNELTQLAYDAEFVLWNPIAQATDPSGRLPDSAAMRELAAVRYSDGKPVLADMNLRGYEVMREILLELGKLDDVAFQELGYQSWSEANQKSKQNDPYIYAGSMKVLQRFLDR
ncbi:hypothetical protein C5Y97_11365 [Blastopirellula marina]|uniref:Peptidase MA-like domain-containing protein n=2 Tax=Blastopirellula marina TaxID=124 RepID=A0A2S8FWN0_9BACT|nr:hypothetical protein C5Y98_11355 [Blastopirellula marina]PTL44415.1 hypothetical protein C5Y97_11365 [Blastopirellula marina]